MDLNKVLLIGRLGGKPEIKKSAAGDPVARMRVATSFQREKDGVWEKETEWHTVVAFGRTAEKCGEFLDKGRLVYVEGALRSNEWTDKEGKARVDREVRARDVYFLDKAPAAPTQALAV
ncbi:MAG: single-stranded DNA-binding protein [Myxococcales bacterium]|nr:single-stranded DNA-binding protein [Myxococcales bacterium]